MSAKDLLETIQGLIPDEIIDGSNVKETAKMVDLDMAFKLLVVEKPVSQDEFQVCSNIPPVELAKKRDDGKYEIRDNGESGPDFRIYTADQMRQMRARFLLLKGYYSVNINRLTLPKQNEARSLYEIYFIPNL
jgi:hypothetical protein